MMRSVSTTATVTLRLKFDVISKLDSLCSISGLSRSALIASFIVSEYDKLSSDPELTKLISQMRDLTLHINEYLSSVADVDKKE